MRRISPIKDCEKYIPIYSPYNSVSFGKISITFTECSPVREKILSSPDDEELVDSLQEVPHTLSPEKVISSQLKSICCSLIHVYISSVYPIQKNKKLTNKHHKEIIKMSN